MHDSRKEFLENLLFKLDQTNDEERLYMLRSMFVTEKDPRGPWVRTFSGGQLFFLTAKPEEINPRDIAQGLAAESRFGGQCDRYYSVAQHCALGAEVIRVGYEFEFLMHDATEGLGLKDIPTPLKMMLPFYYAVEWNVDQVVRKRFGLPEKMSQVVKEMDAKMLATEHAKFCSAPGPGLWSPSEEPIRDMQISPWDPEAAQFRWLQMFYKLGRESGLCLPNEL